MKKTIKYLGTENHSDITIHSFSNDEESQLKAKELINTGKSKIAPRPNVTGITYVLPEDISLNTYEAVENKIFIKESSNEN
ncbi:MAG: hypothetical protein ISP79_06570 [Methylophilaceae bacterium]|nr:hypothetical protein [Methylophilaceae bacterium]